MMIEDQIKQIVAERDEAIKMLAEWCIDIDEGKSPWGECYKNVSFRPCLIRDLIDRKIEELTEIIGG